MFSTQVDVAAIMQEIKKNVVVEEQVAGVEINEVERIADFIQNTRANTNPHLTIGYVLPQNMGRCGIVRKMLRFFYRVVRKSTRFITNDQIIVNQNTDACIKALVESDDAVCRKFEQEIAAMRQELENMKATHGEQSGKINALNTELQNVKKYDKQLGVEGLEETKNKVNQITERVENLERKQIPEEVMSDEMYLEFEKKFRGGETEISERQNFYFDKYLVNMTTENGALAVDLGCGRGEWLQKLGESGFRTIGVDINDSMVDACKKNGQESVNEDAISYLASLESESVSVLTAFQVIEHMPKAKVTKLITEAHRVLKKGGVLILETPNICNIEVGASSFYIDPTHINAVHPAFLQFLAESLGYTKSEIAYWKQREIDAWMESVVSQEENGTVDSAVLRTVLESMKTLVYTSPDYALVAVK